MRALWHRGRTPIATLPLMLNSTFFGTLGLIGLIVLASSILANSSCCSSLVLLTARCFVFHSWNSLPCNTEVAERAAAANEVSHDKGSLRNSCSSVYMGFFLDSGTFRVPVVGYSTRGNRLNPKHKYYCAAKLTVICNVLFWSLLHLLAKTK